MREFLLPTSLELEYVSDTSYDPDRVYSGVGDFYEPQEFGGRDRVDLRNNLNPSLDEFRYRVLALDQASPRSAIELLPIARTSLFLTLHYLPYLALDEVEGDVTYNLEKVDEEWLLVDVLQSLLAKTEDERGVFESKKAEIAADILTHAGSRDASQPRKIRQVYERSRRPWPPRRP